MLGLRLSASLGAQGGWDLAQSEVFFQRLKAPGFDFIHFSSSGVSPKQKIALGANYQVPSARAIRASSAMVTTAVGLITEPALAGACRPLSVQACRRWRNSFIHFRPQPKFVAG
ncbi:beta/alpha barrel domain-containing protein [Rhodoferax antarcticus]|uniref:Flavin oxidoreductase n=1 Tax=Rhodoferax antarcticus ANT.BR TaxID=1111071 RepID=A0A1Q8YHV8_9BURK|nr:hypothetical protein [Rhodoferax antarcticus]APW45240.1 hypothetical protein RA876_01325 [Rhodoferax antarcticus]MCW2310995.1 2,4-dienoyl-CoA reductase-like NADH-dependent reductase (Old Yellow Enzyme family) [Rhodoferax antarcticus]OLP07509.1 flavin oxidoreductase [Rhodoferax antarcticus ANT.BR]